MGETEDLSGGIAAAVMAFVAWSKSAVQGLGSSPQLSDILRTWNWAFLLRSEPDDAMVKPQLVYGWPTRGSEQ